ncbi:cobaltochelatase subunit CobN [Brucella rhizosphaerae]|uniref:CobN/Magnesium Chelatase family protein n=1 Tax=Brucella rhizosphaerae TaxID=571254 RepID=A0A256FTM8_9HYPH|nr:cobaltochelatase subunit CobN [Brucella rhizosphaerae]OYR18199.1 cobN/Magnesium Chelatase family protein [Brucella rhizosphaerae]
MQRILCAMLALLLVMSGAAYAQTDIKDDGRQSEIRTQIVVRVITNAFVLPAKFRKLAPVAQEYGIAFQSVNIEETTSDPATWLKEADIIILDVPRPQDRQAVEDRLGDRLTVATRPIITVGGGRPAWTGINPRPAGLLAGYYGAGGERNFKNFFNLIRDWKQGADLSGYQPAEPMPVTGFYHPEAPQIFENLSEYLAWGSERWKKPTGKVAFVAYSGLVSNMQTKVIDTLISRSEAANLLPIVFWFDGNDPKGLENVLSPAKPDALVNLTHMQDGKARSAEFMELDIPVIQTMVFREGGSKDWGRAVSGVPARTAAIFLAQSEGWGMTDPIVLSAVDNGEAVPLPGQVDALIDKLRRLADLRHKPADQKRIALLFWNYPSGEKNFAASNLNTAKSIETITDRLARAGYDVQRVSESEMIAAGQSLLSGLYRTTPLETLLDQDNAVAFSVHDYEAWLEALPADKQHAFSHWGKPAKHWAVRKVNGVPSFIIPRLKLGKLVVMPQMPRAESVGAHYHDMNSSPDHLYMAAYLYLQKQFEADAIIHLGTHGTQEWLPGKDRGLDAGDYPFLAVGDVPVFYPYIQDNVGEAIQAKRRGRAVIVSHQTPPFLPAGLYDELRDMHHLIHEYQQLDEGAVREQSKTEIVDAAIKANMHTDLGWSEEAVGQDFTGFLAVLHDHLHELARIAMPLGLHSFGLPADPDHRITTIMQQLGKPFYEAVDAGSDELFVDDYAKLKETAPFKVLHQYLREGKDRSDLSVSLRDLIVRADHLEDNLAAPLEIEALLAGLEGRFIPPGTGGDPIRNPEVGSGRNLYAFEPDKIPSKAAFDAGKDAFDQLVSSFREEHDGAYPTKLAFSLWSSEAIRHLGVTEAQVLHAIGARPVWDEGRRVRSLEIIPVTELGRPRIDVVVQVTGVYRDQFDGFMRLLADAMEKIGKLDEKDNPIAANTVRIARLLEEKGISSGEARQVASYRIFSNAPGSYGSGMPHMTMQSTTWEHDGDLAERFLYSTQYAFGAKEWGKSTKAANLFAEQLKGTQAAIMARSSNLHGVLSTDHPFEFLGGLSLAIRHLDGKSPSLYISDLRQGQPNTTMLSRFLSDEMRVRYLNPHWIKGMQAEGYAGTLEILNTVNNFFGWQVMDPSVVRADQWQALFDTYVADTRNLDINAYFDQHNPTAQAQLMERMIEAIRKDYWNAPEQTRRQLVERWQDLAADHGVSVGEPVTKAFIEQMSAGFGLSMSTADAQQNSAEAQDSDGSQQIAAAAASQPIKGQELQETKPSSEADEENWRLWAALVVMVLLLSIGALRQVRVNVSRK